MEFDSLYKRVALILNNKYIFKSDNLEILSIPNILLDRYILDNRENINFKKIDILFNFDKLFNHSHKECILLKKKNIFYRVHKKRIIIIFECFNAKVVLSYDSYGKIVLVSLDNLKGRQIIQYKRNHVNYFIKVDNLANLINIINNFQYNRY